MTGLAWVRAGLAGCLLVPLLTGCGLFSDGGYFEDREDDYLEAEMLPPLEIPDGQDGEAIEDLYYVPAIDKYAQRPEDVSTPRPQGMVAGDFENRVKIQSIDQQQWVLVRLLPGQVWPRLEDFLLTRSLGVGGEDGAAGTVQTLWVQDPQSVLQEQYRFTLEQGVQRNTSEVHLLQRQRREDGRNVDDAPWPGVSDDRQRERLMLQQFANYLANSVESNAAVSLVAQGISTSRRLYMVSGDDPAIRVNLDRERGWASLAYALDKAGFLVDEQSYDDGVYQVSLNPEMHDNKKSLWRRFYGVFKPSALKDKNLEDRQFKVSMKPAAESGWMEIRIVNPAAQARGESSPEAQQQMLDMIKGYLT